MGRKKIQIKPISDEKTRKVTFNRRRNGILKKAYELSILCDTQCVVLMFDRKQMCHVYSSEEGPTSAAELMTKFISKDFCTIDPIRNYDTSPDLQLDDPSQAVWRVSREKVAVVNTYTVVPNTDTPDLSQQQQQHDDDEADGSEQLSVKSSRTYHTKSGDAKFSAINTPALTDKAQSPSRSASPDARKSASPQRSPRRQRQEGLGITGGGFTPVLADHFQPVLYPPPQDHQYAWPPPQTIMTQESMNMIANQQAAISAQYLPNLTYPVQYIPYETPQQRYPPTPLPPILKPSPRKEGAHFNHYTYPPKDEESDAASTAASPQYIYKEYEPKATKAAAVPRTVIEPAVLDPPRRVTRSQSRSPQLKSRTLPLPQVQVHKSQVPIHLRGPSLLDEIQFDPVTGMAMMDPKVLDSWLTGAPLANISPGHSRETSHVRGESVSQWLNLPGIPE